MIKNRNQERATLGNFNIYFHANAIMMTSLPYLIIIRVYFKKVSINVIFETQ